MSDADLLQPGWRESRRQVNGLQLHVLEAGDKDYNESRPHTSLGGTAQGSSDAQHRWKGGGGWMTPVKYAAATAVRAGD